MKTGHTIINIPRAEYEAIYGIETSPYSIGARVVTPQGETTIEFLFLDAEEEIEDLEAMWNCR